MNAVTVRAIARAKGVSDRAVQMRAKKEYWATHVARGRPFKHYVY